MVFCSIQNNLSINISVHQMVFGKKSFLFCNSPNKIFILPHYIRCMFQSHIIMFNQTQNDFNVFPLFTFLASFRNNSQFSSNFKKIRPDLNQLIHFLKRHHIVLTANLKLVMLFSTFPEANS